MHPGFCPHGVPLAFICTRCPMEEDLRDPERDSQGNMPSDHPHTYHHRTSENLDIMDRVRTSCGRLVNYQQSMSSWDDIDCRGCLSVRAN